MPHDGGPDDKIIQLSRAKIELAGTNVEIDEGIIRALGRHLHNTQPRIGPHEIELCSDDIMALESEKEFKKRFGFTLGRRGRIALFDVIDRYDLTSDEVKALFRLGALTWDGSTLRVEGRHWTRFVGISCLLALGFLACCVAIVLLRLPRDAILQRFEALAILTVLIALAAAAYRAFVKPFSLFRRRTGG